MMNAVVTRALSLNLGQTPLAADTKGSLPMSPQLQQYIADRIAEFERIAPERKDQLAQLAQYIHTCRSAHQPASLCYICTHNSRRSHLAQVWSAVAAAHYGLTEVRTYSGGTESTAFNPRAVAALRRAGLAIAQTTSDDNPVYHVRFADDTPPLTCFSKVYDQAPNPRTDFCAVLTCSDADRRCPAVRGAAARVAIPYQDPKASDGTSREKQTYDDCSARIAREMHFSFSLIANNNADDVLDTGARP